MSPRVGFRLSQVEGGEVAAYLVAAFACPLEYGEKADGVSYHAVNYNFDAKAR